MEKPTSKRVLAVLKKLKKSDSQLGQECLKRVEKMLKGNGFSDARLWAKTGLHALIGELGAVEDDLGLEQMVLQLDGFERAAAEAFYQYFTDLQDELGDVKPSDLRDTLVHSIMQVIDTEDKKNYRGIYG